MSDRSRSPSPRHKDYSTGRRRRSRSYERRSYSPRDKRDRYSRSRSPRRPYDYDGGAYRERSYTPEQRYTGRSYGYRRPAGGRNRRSRSHSPMSSRRRHVGNRDDPEPGRCIGVFGLSLHTRERELRDVFDSYGAIESLNVVYDHQSGRSRGFAFISYRDEGCATEAKEACNGIEIDGRKIRVDFSITARAHTPTPGIYLGRPSGGGGGYPRRRSRSPIGYGGGGYGRRGGGYYRSRSRSYSPRRY